MANNVTDAEANALLDARLGSGTPENYYLALFSVHPNANGTGGTELSFPRVEIANDSTNFPAASARTKTNGAPFAFPESTGAQATAVAVVLMDASSGGNARYISNPISLLTPNAGVIHSFPEGSLNFTVA